MNLPELAGRLRRFPWKASALTLRERFREDRLGVTASSLTFTTTMALVPLATVVLAVFTAFPMFSQMESALQAWLVQSLVPEAISRQVLGYLTQFAGKASRLGAVGLGLLLVTALALVLTIDRTLNAIWRVRTRRPLGQRVLVYWAVMTLGPLFLGASMSLTLWVLSTSRGLLGGAPGGLRFLQSVLDVLEFVLLAAGLMALYRWVPHTAVRREHAWAGGIFAALGFEMAKRLLALYLGKVSTYSAVYGAFATLPILLLWIYIAWLIVLFGAVIAAYLPSITEGTHRRGRVPGWHFQVALEALRALREAQGTDVRGLSAQDLSRRLRVDPLQLEPVLEALVALDWAGRLNEAEDEERTRYVLLADPAATPLAPLAARLLLDRSEATAPLWRSGRLDSLRLADAL